MLRCMLTFSVVMLLELQLRAPIPLRASSRIGVLVILGEFAKDALLSNWIDLPIISERRLLFGAVSDPSLALVLKPGIVLRRLKHLQPPCHLVMLNPAQFSAN